MKKLNKLQIIKERILKNEELLTLKGGYDGDLLCYTGTDNGTCLPSSCVVYCGDCSYHAVNSTGSDRCTPS